MTGEDLVIFMPVHVDDSLVATNSLLLYQWMLDKMNQVIEVNNLGAASLYLGIRIDRDCPTRKLWLSQKHVVTDLLTTYNLLNAHPSSVPLHHKLHALPEPPPNSLPDIPDSEIKIYYKCLVGSLLYLALCTRLVKGKIWMSDRNARRSQGESSNTSISLQKQSQQLSLRVVVQLHLFLSRSSSFVFWVEGQLANARRDSGYVIQ